MADGGLDPQALFKSIEEVNKAFDAFQKKNDERLTEIEKKGEADVLLKEQIDRMNADMNKHQESIDAANARIKRLALEEQKSKDGADPELEAKRWGDFASGSYGAGGARDYDAEKMTEYSKLNRHYLRRGEKGFSPDEFKALSVGGDPDGGYVVHPDMSGRIVNRIFETSPVRQYASVTSISTDALEGLHDIDEASFGWVGETASRTETDTPQLDRWRIPVHEMYAEPRATQKIVDDASIDIEAWLSGKIADKFARAEADAFVNGDGVAKPRGFLTYADWATAGTYQLGAIEQFNTGVNGGFTATPAGGDTLLDALYGLKAQYRARAVWMMNRSVTSEVRQLKDSDGAYIWAPGIAAGQPASLLGYPVAAFEDMPNLATGALSIAVGDLGAAYQVVDRIGIRVLRDPFTSKPYIKYYTTKRVGGDVIDFDAIKIINFS